MICANFWFSSYTLPFSLFLLPPPTDQQGEKVLDHERDVGQFAVAFWRTICHHPEESSLRTATSAHVQRVAEYWLDNSDNQCALCRSPLWKKRFCRELLDRQAAWN